MKYNCTTVGGKIFFPKGFEKFVGKQKDGKFTIEIKKYESTRTNQQNDALHLYFDQVSKSLNENGITAQQILKVGMESFWTPVMIKELWRMVQKSMYGTKSTTKLKKIKQIDMIYMAFHKMLVERSGGLVDILFPSIDG